MQTAHRNEFINAPDAPFYAENRMPPVRLLKKDNLVYVDTEGRSYYDARRMTFCDDFVANYNNGELVWVVKGPKGGAPLVIPIEGEWISEDYQVAQSGSGLPLKQGMRNTSFVVIQPGMRL